MIAVDRTSKDPFFRYKMPPVVVNNDPSKTVIVNLDQIAKAICRNPAHIIKFLSINFGCTCVFTPKYALNGSFDILKVQNGIYDFIDLFVLCKSCRNPETRFLFEEPLKRICNSCGSVIPQETTKLNGLIMKDKAVNEDKNYELSNKNSLSLLLKSEGDSSKEIFKCYEQESWGIDQIFNDYIKPKDMKQLSLVFKEFTLDQILENIENMLEMHKKEDKIDSFLKVLIKLGYSAENISEYFAKPRKDKKRSAFLKKNAEFYLENLEEE